MSDCCPLCRSNQTTTVETLPFALLRKLYWKQLKVEVKEVQGLSTIDLRRCEACALKFYVPAMEGDQRFYEALQHFDWYYLADKQEFKFAAQHISTHDRILEVGAGWGAFANKINASAYEGLEFSDAAVELARQRGLALHKASIEEYAKSHANSYDVVCSFQVLEHVADARGFIEASLRCLKKGGKLIQSVPWEDGFLGRQSNNVLNMPPHHVTRWSKVALEKLAEIFDLRVLAFGFDELSDLHLRGYSTALVESCLNRVLGRETRALDSMLQSVFIKAPVRLASIFLEKGLQNKGLRPAGHSATVVYEKR
jgi:2-polyprenyl-3-methyl-5-hydroxy-6-metoxy-1,4-benzoquinol methylase